MISVRVLRVVAYRGGRYSVHYRAQHRRLLFGLIPVWRDLYCTQYVGVDAENVPANYKTAQDAEQAITDWVDNRGPRTIVCREYKV